MDFGVYLYDEDTDGPGDYIGGNLDGNGDPIIDPIVQYCYMRNVTIQAKAAFARRAVTGRGRRKIVRRSGTYDEVTITTNHLVFRKSETWKPDTVFNNWTPLYLVLLLTDFPWRESSFSVKRCFSEDFTIQSEDAAEVIASVNFMGEELV